MNIPAHCILILILPVALIVAGYPLAMRLSQASPAERLSVAILAGLSLFIWSVSVVGFFQPITGAAAWVCLWPLGLGLVLPRARRLCGRDLLSAILNPRGGLVLLCSFGFMVTLLWPLLTQPGLVLYDGTSNHDSFFWISGAEFLREHTYMVEPVKSALQPFTNGVGVFSGGWMPMWGRMSSEGLLALLAAVTGRAPIELYVPATAALYFPWIAATYLVARTFLIGQPTWLALASLCLAQPLFIFFQGNSNLPNLLGALASALVITATARGLPAGPDRIGWVVLLAFALHALLCSYPEMMPFIAIPAGLIWWRSGCSHESSWRPVWPVAFSILAGLALNPATTVRAVSGFFRSFSAARTDDIWPSLFRSLSPSEYAPALATLTLHTRHDLGVIIATACSLLLALVLILVFRQARNRFGAIAMMSGAAILLIYTLATGFNYGWQKTAQFAGTFTAALIPFAAVDLLSRPKGSRRFSLLSRLALVCVGCFFLYATARNAYESHKWSHRKFITSDWLAVRDYARVQLRHQPVLIDAPSFPAPYFQGMWATYFFADSHPLFADRDPVKGGYLHDYTRAESQARTEIPQAYVVSAAWAASVDSNSPRLVNGRDVVLLSRANRIDQLAGFSPAAGLPKLASADLMIELRPHSDSHLTVELAPAPGIELSSVHWQVTWTNQLGESTVREISSPPPWWFSVPLNADRKNRIEFKAKGQGVGAPFPFAVHQLQVNF